MPDIDKPRLYPFVTQYLDRPEPIFWELPLHPKPMFDDDGTVWRGKKRVGFWYALIGSARGILVRRDKLRDLEHIEALRWRAIERMHGVVWERRKKAIVRADKLGRIWYDDQFYYSDAEGQPQRRRDKDLEGEKGDVISKMAQIPTPEEEAAGAEYQAADQWLRDYWTRIGNLAEILRKAMRTHADAPKEAYTMPSRTKAISVTYRLNGRLYVNYTPNGWGVQTTEVWPDPGDESYVVPKTKETFRACSICGLKHNRKVRNCEHCPRHALPRHRRRDGPRGGLLRSKRRRWLD